MVTLPVPLTVKPPEPESTPLSVVPSEPLMVSRKPSLLTLPATVSRWPLPLLLVQL